MRGFSLDGDSELAAVTVAVAVRFTMAP